MWPFSKKKSKDESEQESKADGVSSPVHVPSTPVATSVPNAPSEKKFVVRYEWKKCIGSGVCEAVAPAHFRVENGKAILTGSKLVNDVEKVYEKEIGEAEMDTSKMAADGCPPNCIRVFDVQTGEEIAPKR